MRAVTASLVGEGEDVAVRRSCITTDAGKVLEGGRTMRDLSGARHPATKAVWAGEEGYLAEGATQVPIVQSIPFGYDDLDEWTDVALGDREGHIYSRNTNPTTRAFEEKVRALEGGGRTRRVSQPGWRSSVTPCSPS
jgi:Cys/Met metabolism PLP-dependent enzyme